MFMLLTFILLFNLCFLHIPSFALFHRIFSHIPATCDIFTSPLLPSPSPFPSPSSSSPSPPSLSSYFPFSALSASSPSTPSAAGPRREFHHEGFSLPEHGRRGVTWEGKGGEGNRRRIGECKRLMERPERGEGMREGEKKRPRECLRPWGVRVLFHGGGRKERKGYLYVFPLSRKVVQ